jgi:Flp pilus assembly protein TadB
VALTFIAIVLLAAAWAALLLPDLRGRGGSSRRSDSIANFNRQLSTIERARPGHRPSARVVAFPQRAGAPVRPVGRPSGSSLAPRSSAHARKRRQNLLLALLGVAVVTLVAGIVVMPLLLVVHLVADAALGGYVYLLVQHRNQMYERRTTRDLRAGYEAPPVARRRASGS